MAIPNWLRELAERFPKVPTFTLYLCPECKDVSLVPVGREFRKCGVSYCAGNMLEPLLDIDALIKVIQDTEGNVLKQRKGTKEPAWHQ
jgi:hypothetical protein